MFILTIICYNGFSWGIDVMTMKTNLRLREEKGSIIITCSSYTSKNELKKYLNNRIKNVESVFDDIFSFDFIKDFEIIINDYEGIVLLVLEKPSNEKEYYLFDDEVRYLKVANNKNIVLKSNSITITNDSLDDKDNTNLLVSFINYLEELNNTIPFNFESVRLCTNLRIFNSKYNKIIIEDDDFILALPNFYKETLHKLQLHIVSKSGLRIVGSLECVFNDLECDNFKYRGNVNINLYPEFKNIGCEVQVLNLLKKYVDGSSEPVNKEMFIAATPDDDETCEIAQSSGGVLVYEGVVPKSDPLNFMGKVREVKIYRIG